MTSNTDTEYPPSPLDSILRGLDIAGFVNIGIAIGFGWMAARWWGVGLAACLFVSEMVSEYKEHLRRTELLELMSAGFAKWTPAGIEIKNMLRARRID